MPVNEHRLDLKIVAIHRGVAPSGSPPFRADGGRWLFIDLAAAGDPSATFTVGLPPTGKTFDRLQLVPGPRENGRRLVAALARAFGIEVPAPEAEETLAPVTLEFTWLGATAQRCETKWFVAKTEGEVFFNLDGSTGTAEFLEKDPHDSPTVVDVFAEVLGDGRMAPERDPRVSDKGPIFANVRPLSGGEMSFLRFEGERAVFNVSPDRNGTGRLLSVDLATGESTEIARVKGRLRATWCDALGGCWLVQEGANEQARLSILSRGESEPIAFQRSGEWYAAHGAVSPDARFVAVSEWAERTTKPGRYSFTHIVDRTSGRSVVVRDGEDSFEVEGWRAEGTTVVAQAVRITGYGSKTKREPIDIDPLTGAVQNSTRDAASTGDRRGWAAAPESPDGRWRAALEPGGVVFTDRANGATRTFPLRRREARSARPDEFEWVSPRHVLWHFGGRTVFIDCETLRMNFAIGTEPQGRIMIAPGFRHALLLVGRLTYSVADIESR